MHDLHYFWHFVLNERRTRLPGGYLYQLPPRFLHNSAPLETVCRYNLPCQLWHAASIICARQVACGPAGRPPGGRAGRTESGRRHPPHSSPAPPATRPNLGLIEPSIARSRRLIELFIVGGYRVTRTGLRRGPIDSRCPAPSRGRRRFSRSLGRTGSRMPITGSGHRRRFW